VTPRIEITVMIEMKVCFLLALRYLRPINHSYFITISESGNGGVSN
jgi:hypothetical protein